MSKYAPVGPIAILEDLHDKNLLGDYVLLLAHDVLENEDRYRKLCRDLRQHYGNNMTIILDNSVIEQGEPLSAREIRNAADVTLADIVSLPDVLRDRSETIALIREFLDSTSVSDYMDFKWMAIPQGRTYEEIQWCVEDILSLLPKAPFFWGVPRWIASELGSREPLIEYLMNAAPPRRDKWIHLLGMSTSLQDDIKCARWPVVAGIDSANPIMMGLFEKELLSEWVHMSRIQGDDWDYMLDAQHVSNLVEINIAKLRSLIFHDVI